MRFISKISINIPLMAARVQRYSQKAQIFEVSCFIIKCQVNSTYKSTLYSLLSYYKNIFNGFQLSKIAILGECTVLSYGFQ